MPFSKHTGDAVTFFLVAGAAGLAVVSAMAGDNKFAFVLPLALAVALALGILAITRFEAYVLVLLAARASLDLTKLSAPGGGGGLSRAIDPAGLLGIQFIVLATFWLAAQHRARDLEPVSPLTKALAVFIAACVLSLVSSRDLVPSAIELIRIFTAVSMFVVLEQLLGNPAILRRALMAVYASALFPLALTAFGFLTGNPRSEGKGGFVRIMGTFNQSNTFGRYLMLLTVFGVALWPHLEPKIRRWMTGVLAGCAVCLPLTYTRSAIIGAGLGLLVVGLLQSRNLILGLILASVLALALVPQFALRFSELAEPVPSSSDRAGNSLQWRLEYWGQVATLARRSPVWGIGLGQTQRITEAQKQPHNDVLRAFVETGLLGLAGYLLSLFAMVRLAYLAVTATRADRLDPSIRRGVAVGFAGCVAAFISVSLVANVITNVVNLWYFLTFAAAASCVARSKESTHQWRSATIST
ncbi:hypothetical protein BH23ACT12_BH23ACT12_18440 [soil metagenome]